MLTKTLEEKTPVARLFERRLVHHTAQGLRGAAVFEALSIDEELPGLLDPMDVADIMGVRLASLKRRRQVADPPAYIRLGGQIVKYPRAEFCRVLARNYRESAPMQAAE